MAKNPSRRVWFTSDQHFGHRKIIEYCRPQFRDLDHMERTIIEGHNDTVGDGDLVYCLGDFAFDVKTILRVRPLLRGTLRLIVGNHDPIVDLCQRANGVFQKVQFWRSFPEYGFHATHVPMRRQHLRHANLNVHGHVHGDATNLEDFHRDVSVEATGFLPVSAVELKEWARTWRPDREKPFRERWSGEGRPADGTLEMIRNKLNSGEPLFEGDASQSPVVVGPLTLD